MSTPPPSSTHPAGWYPDPWQPGQRYWDGRIWTHHTTPATATATPTAAFTPAGPPARTGDWVGGVLLSVLIPFVGFIAGIVYVVKGGERRKVGIMCLVLSSVMFLLWLS